VRASARAACEEETAVKEESRSARAGAPLPQSRRRYGRASLGAGSARAQVCACGNHLEISRTALFRVGLGISLYFESTSARVQLEIRLPSAVSRAVSTDASVYGRECLRTRVCAEQYTHSAHVRAAQYARQMKSIKCLVFPPKALNGMRRLSNEIN
jgi:hypothetical protein